MSTRLGAKPAAVEDKDLRNVQVGASDGLDDKSYISFPAVNHFYALYYGPLGEYRGTGIISAGKASSIKYGAVPVGGPDSPMTIGRTNLLSGGILDGT